MRLKKLAAALMADNNVWITFNRLRFVAMIQQAQVRIQRQMKRLQQPLRYGDQQRIRLRKMANGFRQCVNKFNSEHPDWDLNF